MKVIKGYPPNFQKIKEKFFPDSEVGNVVFTYGDICYYPNGKKISPHLVAHESTHTRQQGDDPEGWWDRYISDPEFRLNEEVKAYRNQYQWYRMNGDRNNRRNFLSRISADLSSPIYGSIITFGEAKQLISNGQE